MLHFDTQLLYLVLLHLIEEQMVVEIIDVPFLERVLQGVSCYNRMTIGGHLCSFRILGKNSFRQGEAMSLSV